MGNTTTKDVGDFQEGAGKVFANLQVISAVFFGVILIIVGIVMCILAFVPFTTDIPCTSDSNCTNGPGDYCKNPFMTKDRNNTYVTADPMQQRYCEKPEPKKKHYWFLGVGIFFIVLSIAIIWISIWWRGYAMRNRTAAQVGAMAGEAGLLSRDF